MKWFMTQRLGFGLSVLNMSLSMSTKAFSPFVSPTSLLKGVFVGSGSDGMNHPEIANAVLSLTEKETKPNDIHVLYLGTATYDLPGPRERQTQRFREAGCVVTSLDVVTNAPTKNAMEQIVSKSDVILVSGGNTLFAVDRWTTLGLHKILYEKGMMRGAVLTGGSAGAICWFQGGHSDSMDPDTYKTAMLKDKDKGGDESSSAPLTKQEKKEWEYIRVNGLGFLPGLICPHHDVTQSNGILRSVDFDAMILRHSSEFGIGIDHWAALEISNGNFRVISVKDKVGSAILPQGEFSPERKGIPGIWLKRVMDGDQVVHSKLCPTTGTIDQIFLQPNQKVIQDPRVDKCRLQNPDDGPRNNHNEER